MKKLVIVTTLVLIITFSYGQGILTISSSNSNSQTKLSFSLQETAFVNISVYNIKGQHIVTLVNGKMSPGNHKIIWNWTDKNKNRVSNGIYLFKLTCGNTLPLVK